MVTNAADWPKNADGTNKTVHQMSEQERATVLRPVLAGLLAALPENRLSVEEAEQALLDGRLGLQSVDLVRSVYSWQSEDGNYIAQWDIDQAIREVAEGNFFAIDWLTDEAKQGVYERCGWDADKLARVDPSIPGIGAPLRIPSLGVVSYILIDGTHRCVRAYLEKLPFGAKLLTDEAAKRCLVRADPELIPW